MRKNILVKALTAFILLSLFNCAHSKISALSADNDLVVHFIDVGQGDSIFIALPGGENMLIDVGGPAAGPNLVQYLKSLEVKQVDHLIFTHAHDDHIGGIFSVMAEFDITHFYDNGFSNFQSTIYPDYVQSVRGNLSQYKILQAGEYLDFNTVRIEVLNPLLPPSGNLNNDSIVLKLMYGDIKILLAGDMGRYGEKRLINIGTDLKSQILKVGHHAGDDANSDDFIARIDPEVAIISVSTINKYAQPHDEVMKRLRQAGAKIYRTDQSGHVTLRTDGKTFSIKTEK